jgi:hypothetical protein
MSILVVSFFLDVLDGEPIVSNRGGGSSIAVLSRNLDIDFDRG